MYQRFNEFIIIIICIVNILNFLPLYIYQSLLKLCNIIISMNSFVRNLLSTTRVLCQVVSELLIQLAYGQLCQ